jgi:hypothetical protein
MIQALYWEYLYVYGDQKTKQYKSGHIFAIVQAKTETKLTNI